MKNVIKISRYNNNKNASISCMPALVHLHLTLRLFVGCWICVVVWASTWDMVGVVAVIVEVTHEERAEMPCVVELI